MATDVNDEGVRGVCDGCDGDGPELPALSWMWLPPAQEFIQLSTLFPQISTPWRGTHTWN